MAIRRITSRNYLPRETRKRLWRPRFGVRLVPLLLAVMGLLLLVAASIVLWWSKDLPDPQKINTREVVQSTKIFDRTGTNLLYEIGEVRRTTVTLSQISPHLINATLAAEDDQFYQHHGLDFYGIARAVLKNLTRGDLVGQGGSTITQQLVKNSILTPEKTLRRKVKEAVLAIELEQRFSKDEIMAMYLNEIPYGSQSYGVQAAAQTFFGQPAANVSLAQAALIAAVAKAPSYYSPYGSHFEDLKMRQEAVLKRMVELKLVTKEEAEQAKGEKLDFQPRRESITAPHFVFYVKQFLDQQYGERVVEQGGLKATTTLDMRLQTIAEKILKDNQKKLKQMGASNASLVAIDPKTGDILAMAGSIDYFNEEIDGNVNVSIRHRSPGSSIKPFIYAAAWQKGFTPETILIDAETDFGQGYRPKNYDLNEHGPVSMRQALSNSLNIPAVQTLYLAGVKQATDLAQAMGMTSLNDPDRYGLSLVLGGGEVRLVDEVSAYGVFANDGTRYPHRAILKVESNNEAIFDAVKEEVPGEQVIAAQLARKVTNVLSDNNARAMIFGTRSHLQLGSRPVAAKTGTAQDFRDGWTLGYTPSLAAGVWVGNNDNSPMGAKSDGVYTAAPIWNAFMKQALDGTPIEQFVGPETEDRPVHAILRGEIPETKGKWDADTGIFYTSDCPVALGQPTTFKEIHNILFYVNKDNPQGNPPAEAETDPQYSRWEKAVEGWRVKHAEKNKEKPEEPRYVGSLPVPECGVQNSEDMPKVKITEPTTTILRSSPVEVRAEIESPTELKEVRFVFDGKEIAKRSPTDELVATINFDAGFVGRKTLIVQAITRNNLIGRAHRTFIINPDDSLPTVILHTPQNGKELHLGDFPLTVKVTAKDNSGIDFVDVLAQKDGEGTTKRIGRTSAQSAVAQDRYEVKWSDSPGSGTYVVYAVAYDKTGNTKESTRHTVTVE